MKHKVGDVVQIKSLDWYNKNKDEDGWIRKEGTLVFVTEMSKYCGMMTKIARILNNVYLIYIDNGEWGWFDCVFEEEVGVEENHSVEEEEITEKTHEGIENIREINDNKEETEDMVNHPSHYTWLKDKCGIEVIDIIRHLDFDLGNSVKYILRSNHKHDASMTDKEKAIQDLEKAIFYLKDEINLIKKI